MNLLITLALAASYLFWVDSANAAVEISGNLTSDTTWSNSDTIIVTDAVTVTSLATLTIEAGTVIMFRPNTTINIDGTISAPGLAYSRIIFTSSADTAGGSPEAGAWYGMNFREFGAGILENCELRYGIDNIHIFKSSAEFNNCLIENFSGRGIYIDGFYPEPSISVYINNCVIRQEDAALKGTGTGIYAYRMADVFISGTEINGCTYGMYYVGSAAFVPSFQISRCDIRGHVLGGIYTLSGG